VRRAPLRWVNLNDRLREWRDRFCLAHQLEEILPCAAQADKEVGDISSLAYVCRQCDQFGLGQELPHLSRSLLAGLVVIIADIKVRDGAERPRPVFPKGAGTARGSNHAEAPGFQDQPIEFPFTDNEDTGTAPHILPAVEFHMGAAGRHHLRTGALVCRVLGKLKEGELSRGVEDRDGDAPPVPAEQIQIDQGIRNASVVEVRTDSVWQRLVVFGSKLMWYLAASSY
jgi:hypothetical protein